MENIIIIGLLFVAIIFGVVHTIKHFKGEGSCCGGGGDYEVKEKKLNNIAYKKTFFIDGMHCDHCKNSVEEIINSFDGVSGKVNLKKGEAVVSYEKETDDMIIKEKIEKAGFVVSCIK